MGVDKARVADKDRIASSPRADSTRLQASARGGARMQVTTGPHPPLGVSPEQGNEIGAA